MYRRLAGGSEKETNLTSISSKPKVGGDISKTVRGARWIGSGWPDGHAEVENGRFMGGKPGGQYHN